MSWIKLFLPLFFIGLTACNETANGQTHTIKIDAINEYPFLFNDTEPGGMVVFSNQSSIPCELYFSLEILQQGFKQRVETANSNDAKIDLLCTSQQGIYSLDVSGKTFIDIAVKSQEKSYVFILNANLFERGKAQFHKLENLVIYMDEKRTKTIRKTASQLQKSP